MTDGRLRCKQFAPAILLFGFFVLFADAAAAQSNYVLVSPNQKIELRIRLADRIRYDVLLNRRLLLRDSALSLQSETLSAGLDPIVVIKTQRRTIDQIIHPPVRQKSATI